MRKPALWLLVLALGLVAGCGGKSPTPSPSPTAAPPTAAPLTVTAAPSVTATPAGPATCVQSPLSFPADPRIPAVTDEDHVEGPAGASITFIEYADFQ